MLGEIEKYKEEDEEETGEKERSVCVSVENASES